MANDRFLGTGMKFPPQVDPATGRFITVSGNQSVKESLYLILMTQTTERLVRPDFGSDIMGYTFMDTNTTMMSILRRDLTQTILAQEPRISDIDIETDYRQEKGAIIINIDYMVSDTNTRDNLVFPFYLDRGDTDMEEEEGSMDRDYDAEMYDDHMYMEEDAL